MVLNQKFTGNNIRDIPINQHRQKSDIFRESALARACQFFRNLHLQKTPDSLQIPTNMIAK